MSPKERYEWLWKQVAKPLPNYKDVIREEWLKALSPANERPVLDLTDDSC